MKLALYRKYRPARFSDVVGQQAVTAALKNQLAAGRFGHAYLFTGVRGTGKTSLAKIMARAVNCPNAEDGEPCGACEICRGIENGSILDVTEIDAASNNRVDNVRDLLEESAYAPSICRMRVYIIDEVHMLSNSAFNALLKTLEEPPAHVLFILATTEIQKVPATILSRCQRFDLKRIPEALIRQRLLDVAEKEQISLTEPAAALIARLADGALRDALSILDTTASLGGVVDEDTVKQLAGVSDRSYLFSLCEAVRRGDINGVLTQLAQLYRDSADPARLLNELIRHHRDLLMVRVGGVSLKDCSDEMQARYRELSAGLDERQILSTLAVLADAAERMNRTLDREITLELALLQLAGSSSSLAAYSAGAVPAPSVSRPASFAQQSQTPQPAARPAAAPAAAQKEATRAELPMGEDGLPQLPFEPDNLPQAAPAAAQEPQPSLPELPPLPEEPAAEEPAAPAQPQPVSAEGLLPQWPQVVEAVRAQNKMLGALLAKSAAHVTATHLLIEASEMAIKFIRENADSRQTIKEALLQVTGLRLPVGPWKAPAAAVSRSEDDGLEAFLQSARDAGVEVRKK